MAVVVLNRPSAYGVEYSHVVDSSADYGSVPVDKKFYDKALKDVFYKNVDGTILGVFSVFDSPFQTTGSVVSFTTPKVYNTPAAASSSNLTSDFTGAKFGLIQKLYHSHTSAPTVPAEWVLVGSGVYVPSALNIYYIEYVSNTRVEYWIVQ